MKLYFQFKEKTKTKNRMKNMCVERMLGKQFDYEFVFISSIHFSFVQTICHFFQWYNHIRHIFKLLTKWILNKLQRIVSVSNETEYFISTNIGLTGIINSFLSTQSFEGTVSSCVTFLLTWHRLVRFGNTNKNVRERRKKNTHKIYQIQLNVAEILTFN